MKLHFFLLRIPKNILGVPTNFQDKDHAHSASNRASYVNDGTNQSLISIRDNKKKTEWFLFRMIRHRRSRNRNKILAKKSVKIETPTRSTVSRVSSSPTTSISTVKNESNKIADAAIMYEKPLSFVRINPKEMDETSQCDLLQKLTSTNLMMKHGLDRKDSIISYFKQVDDAYNEMAIVADPTDRSTEIPESIDSDSHTDEDLYNEQNAIDQSISLITMDPALVYHHSIIIDEYSWKSFQSLSESDDDYYNENRHETNDDIVAPIRYCHI
jgi:hypothetical protein